jgi:hypothetical protein
MIALLAALQAPAREFSRIQTLALDAGFEAHGASLADLDGDGAPEVLLALHERGKDFSRSIEVWKSGAGGALSRAERIPLTPDVVAFAHADLRAGGGEELVLFNAGGAFLWLRGENARPERILECDFLWQTADPESAFEWSEGLRDLDGDGFTDLVVPEPGGFAVALQRRSGVQGAPWGVVSRARVPEDASDEPIWESAALRRGGMEHRESNGSFSIGLSTREAVAGSDAADLLRVSEHVPAPFWLDWDADGDLDLVLQTPHALHVWTLTPAGTLSSAPQLSLSLPVVEDTARELDASYSAHVVDLDADGRADCVIFAGDKRSEDVRTQGLFFTQAAVREAAPLFGKDGRPSSLLVFAGFISGPTFKDLDGDGFPELTLRAVRPDLIDQIRSASTESIDSDLYVYRNRGGVLSRQPDVVRSHAIPLEAFQLRAEFFGDVTGDGLSELFVRDDPEHVRVLMLRAQGPKEKSTWSLLEKPLWELEVGEKARVQIPPPRKGSKPSLFILEAGHVLWVRFG